MSQKKPDAAVAAAEAMLAACTAEHIAAADRLQALILKCRGAREALDEALIAADAALPKCLMVFHPRHSPARKVAAVIERKTPSGLLIVRFVGGARDTIRRFKFDSYGKEYREVKSASSSFYSTGITTLRDVPDEFMPLSNPT
jgi:hypothetical protein